MNGRQFKLCLQSAAEKLDKHKEEVNKLNVFPVPDGDTGTNMSMTIHSAVEQVAKADDRDIPAIAQAMSMGSLMGARGNSGVILSQLFRGMAEACKGKDSLRIVDFRDIANSAREMAYKAVMKPTEGTILTVARAMSEFGAANFAHYHSIEEFITDGLIYANHTLQQTPEMLPTLKEAGVVDSGGQGLVYILAGFLEGVTGESADPILERSKTELKDVVVTDTERKTALKNAKNYFFTANLLHISRDELEKTVKRYGEIHMIVEDGDQMVVEAYTDDPGRILDVFTRQGEVVKAAIFTSRSHPALSTEKAAASEDTPELEAEEVREEGSEQAAEEKKAKPGFSRKYGFVAVSKGAGFDAIFKNLMVDEIVAGGQTMNPSTQDILKAVEKVPANTVFVLPNNSNIFMAAQQVCHFASQEVIIIPSKSIPQGITALFNYDEALSPEENKRMMTEGLKSVKTGEITYSVRDTEINGKKIHKGDFIGMIDGDLRITGQDAEMALLDLLKETVGEEDSLITVYTGEELAGQDLSGLQRKAQEAYPGLDVEFVEGGQPIYRYVFSVE